MRRFKRIISLLLPLFILVSCAKSPVSKTSSTSMSFNAFSSQDLSSEISSQSFYSSGISSSAITSVKGNISSKSGSKVQSSISQNNGGNVESMKNIVNIINFIRGVEPRNPHLDLVEPVREQLDLLDTLGLKGTFLFQYDALIDDRFTELFRDDKTNELGLWFEVVEPLCKDSNIKWTGRKGYSWDWFAHCGFLVGYTPEQRRKLIDTAMNRFKSKFGKYPDAVGAWIIDSVSLDYLEDKYNVKACAICRDQWGTDGYNLWGGYYGQGYYPSKYNVLSPAQSKDKQINVPVFRMLGSDPVYQYDAGLVHINTDGSKYYEPSGHQPVMTLEPVYPEAGGSQKWVDWFFRENFNSKALSFGYAQAGQENSFGWDSMRRGLIYQFKKIKRLAEQGQLSVMTLGETGAWYKGKFKDFTPASAICCDSAYDNIDTASYWYESKSYRANVMLEDGNLWIRDIHKFDENYKERYYDKVCTTDSFTYDNLPVIDGNQWSGGDIRSGLYIYKNGKKLNFTDCESKTEDNKLTVEATASGYKIRMVFSEYNIKIEADNSLELKILYSDTTSRPFPIVSVEKNRIAYRHEGFSYQINITNGTAKNNGNSILIFPQGNYVEINI